VLTVFLTSTQSPRSYSVLETALDVALTNVCAYCLPTGDAPTLIVNVSVVVAEISRICFAAGSVERGYAVWKVFPS